MLRPTSWSGTWESTGGRVAGQRSPAVAPGPFNRTTPIQRGTYRSMYFARSFELHGYLMLRHPVLRTATRPDLPSRDTLDRIPRGERVRVLIVAAHTFGELRLSRKAFRGSVLSRMACMRQRVGGSLQEQDEHRARKAAGTLLLGRLRAAGRALAIGETNDARSVPCLTGIRCPTPRSTARTHVS